ARLGEGNKNWVEELPHVLWAHRTMIKSSHGDTPFSLTYGTEAVIPTKIEMPTCRTAAVDVVSNDEELRLILDLLEERRERAAICEAKAKLKMTKYYNARVRGVLCIVETTHSTACVSYVLRGSLCVHTQRLGHMSDKDSESTAARVATRLCGRPLIGMFGL
nr:reverse transcriptase domain-containing protein [Tanacetum cinerariifolium]